MKLENASRIIKALSEHATISNNISTLTHLAEEICIGESGILFQQHSDGYGIRTEHCYSNGNYNVEMNEELVNAVIDIHTRYLHKLEQEILSL